MSTTEDSVRRVLTYPALLAVAEVGVAAYVYAQNKFPATAKRLLCSLANTTVQSIQPHEAIAAAAASSSMMAHYSPGDATTAAYIALYVRDAAYTYPQDFLDAVEVPDIAGLLAPLLPKEHGEPSTVGEAISKVLMDARNSGIPYSAMASELKLAASTVSGYATGRILPPKRRREAFYAKAQQVVDKLTAKKQREEDNA